MNIKHIVFLCFFVTSVSAQITNTRKWRYSERDSLDLALVFYEEQNYKLALPILENVHLSHPTEDFIKYLYGICCLYRSDKHGASLKALAEVYANNQKIDKIEYDLARAYHYNYKFDETAELLNKHLSYKRIKQEDREKTELLRTYINNAKYYHYHQTKAKVTNLGVEINSKDDESMPLISVDESVIVFNYAGSKSKGGKLNGFLKPDINGIYTSDIYLSKKLNNKFQSPIPLDNINTIGNETAVSLSQDGQILYSYKDLSDGHGDIYASYLNGNTYSQPAKLKGKINSYSWEGNCSLSPDGKTLYFSSERNGGFGGKDIYSAKLLADSVWGKITNLGDSINTPYDEDFPFLHADGTTLFYSSKGIKSSGGYDIFAASMNIKDSTFKQVENLAYPINTPDDDINFVLAANGLKAYYAKGKKDGYGLQDIYTIDTGFEPNKFKLLLLKGTIAKSAEVVDAEIKVEILSKNNYLFKNFKSNNGNYIVTLPMGNEYKVTFTKANSPTQTLTLTTNGFNGYLEKNFDVNFDQIQTVVNATKTSTLNAIKTNSLTNTVSSKSPTIATSIAAVTSTSVTETKVVTTTVTSVTTSTNTITKVVTPTLNSSPTNTIAKAVTPTITSSSTNTIAKVVTPSVNPTSTNTITKVVTPSVAATKTLSTSSKINPETYYTTNTVAPITSPTVASVKTAVSPSNTSNANVATIDNFVPRTPAQEKVRLFAQKYPDISADSLEFRVQIAAFKNPKNYEFPHLNKLGPFDNLLLIDGITRVTVGGKFTTLRKAYEHNKKVVIAGQNDAFVTVIYKGKRIVFEDLEAMGIFKTK
ncbi:MAG: hypothetical protein Q7W45_01535 [Bacteroidota bacterium]|nr:hypothetical protein [Bacteroidota bacterium]MDP3147199.1 hypothetical protein [Bacteroidota bacterium]